MPLENKRGRDRKMLQVLDANLKELASFNSRNDSDFRGLKQALFFAGNPYEVDGNIFYKEPLIDTIYKVNEDKLIPHWVVTSKGYKMDMRDALTLKKSPGASDKMTTPGIKETKTRFYINYFYKNAKYHSVFDKVLNSFVFHKKYTQDDFEKSQGKLSFGFTNDVIEKAPNFWPSFIGKNIIVSATLPVTLNQEQLDSFNVKEDDNPILFIAEFK